MGNCLERSRRCRGRGGEHCARKRAVWAKEKVVAAEKEERQEAEARKSESAAPGTTPPPPPATEVKIRITRKQLEELLRRVDDGKQDDGGGVPARKVISELLCEASSSSFQHRGDQGHWRPSLQSIPE